MLLANKILLILLSSIFFIAIVNIVSFYIFYSNYLKIYLADKINSKEEVTIDYINNIIEKQAIEDINNIFRDIELEFFELLELNDWKIPLNNENNIDIVINYLLKTWVAPKYIEEIIPDNYFEKILDSLKDKDSLEYKFINNLTKSIILTNIFAIIFLIFVFLIISSIILEPIRRTTKNIKKLQIWTDFRIINYNKKDEIWLLVNALNWLNAKLSIQDNIRNKLLADISHELKTPITSIQCYLEWIKDGVIKLDNNILDNIISEMERLIKLVNKIMEYEKFEAKDITLNLEKINIKKLIENIANNYSLQLEKTKQNILVSWYDWEFVTDKDSFIQIVHNIISNFIKYAWENTTLNILIKPSFISFKDNWKWVNKNELPFIREKFYQAKTEKTWDIESRWIWVWLNIIEKLAKKLNYKVEIISEENNWFEIKIFT